MFSRSLIRNIAAWRSLSIIAGHSKRHTQSAIINTRKIVCSVNSNTSHRLYSTSQSNTEEFVVDYDYVKNATSDNNILIIDVREPDEVKEHGKIPNSINIPLGDVATVLSTLPNKEFEKIYQRPKPTENTRIVFYCMVGRRSGMAQQNAINIGFKNVKNYLGSWTDWAAKSQS